MGLLIAQMSRIQHAVHPEREHDFKYNVLGIPQAALCQVMAVIIVCVGAYRFFKQEQVMLDGGARIKGWDLYAVIGLVLSVCPLRTLPFAH